MWDRFQWVDLIVSPISNNLTYIRTSVHDGVVFAQLSTSKHEIWILQCNDICINPLNGDIAEFDSQDSNSVNHVACHLFSSCNFDMTLWDDNNLCFDSWSDARAAWEF